MKKRINRMVRQTEFWVFVIIVVWALIVEMRSGAFFTNNNLVDIVRSIICPSLYAICAMLAFVSTGGPDVSFPLVAALSSYLAIDITTKMGYTGSWITVYLIGMFFGALMGAVNGAIIVKYKFPSLIVTLGTSSIFSGILLGGFEAQRMDLPMPLQSFGEKVLLAVKNEKTGLGATLPMTFLIMVAVYFVTFLVLKYTMVGRGIYAIGGDEVSAERAGFQVNKIRFGVFVANGMIAAIAGLSYSVMSMRYLPNEYAGAEMSVIAAIVLGGTRLTGGVGTLTGCVLGTFLLTMVTNSLILVGISVYWQKVFIGAIIIIGTAVPMIQKYIGNKKTKKEEA